MSQPFVLASSSAIRRDLLRNAGLEVSTQAARIDEDTIRQSLEAEAAKPRDIADALAEMKAAKVSARMPGALVLGCDQVLDFKGQVFAKPETAAEARQHLLALRGQTHSLLSAAVLYESGKPVWRHVGQARLTMRSFSDTYLDAYLTRNWPAIGHSVGGYQLESEGVRLFDRIEGDYFTILGLPLLPLLSYLATRGLIPA
ncbi:Maf family protein [Tabrizicola oligotrophica]|uniref:Nucleoside triphosphate pyrophosphatase n=1 Tax=Tabrizicola oligotrophica TaxID=2710650 RepID=A0A6M0QS11_9RHOB|nr:Maf family protein [Tabrizicola oligotrophica]NEY90309.1 septum formation protein Maf [Tabrizicola oligotrophica]